MLKAVIFDIGGVIVRTEDQRPREGLARSYGLTPQELYHLVFDSEQAKQATAGVVPEVAVWNYVDDQLNLTPSESAYFYREFWAGDQADQELLAFIRELRPEYKTVLLSNAWSNARVLLNADYGLEPMVDLMVISAEEKVAKPDPRIYQIALDRIGVLPEEAVFIDDVLTNIEAARSLGMQAIQFKSTGQVIADLEKLKAETRS